MYKRVRTYTHSSIQHTRVVQILKLKDNNNSDKKKNTAHVHKNNSQIILYNFI